MSGPGRCEVKEQVSQDAGGQEGGEGGRGGA